MLLTVQMKHTSQSELVRTKKEMICASGLFGRRVFADIYKVYKNDYTYKGEISREIDILQQYTTTVRCGTILGSTSTQQPSLTDTFTIDSFRPKYGA